jgi:hypothetical protein
VQRMGLQHRARRGKAVQVDFMKLNLKPLGTDPLKLKCDIPLSTSAFNLNLRRYTVQQMYSYSQCSLKYQAGLCSRVTRYPIYIRRMTISIRRMTISILSSPISSANVPYRHPG